MSHLFQLGDDSFHYLLGWLGLACLCKLDIAIGNKDERLFWLHSLHTMDSKGVNEHWHEHLSIRWLIMRGVRATRIRIRETNLKRNGITDETFAGVGILSSQQGDTNASDCILCTGCASPLRSCISESHKLQDRDIATDIDTYTSVRSRGSHNLTSIDLTHCKSISDIGVTAIAEGCHHLTSINLNYCGSISDIALSAIAGGCHHLTSIDLSNCDVSDIGVTAIAEGCHHLTSIRLCNCDVSDIGVTAIAEGCRDLTSINLRDSDNISDIGVTALAEGCPHLKSIILSNCDSISDIGVTAIAEGCHHLTLIGLSKCKISNIGLSALAEGCHDLTFINLRDCDNISDIGVTALAEGCPHLKSINLSHYYHSSSGISTSFIISFRKTYPYLTVIHD